MTIAGGALITVLVLALAATPAGAQQAKPEPTSCAGLAFTDAAGDAITTRRNLDLKAGFLRYVTNSAGENVLTANIQVTDLDESSEVGSYVSEWRFGWTVDSTRQYVRARMHSRMSPVVPGQVIYSYGVEGDHSTRRSTTGRMFLGKDGIVEIVVPVAKLGLAGKRLTDLHAVSQFEYTDGLHTYPPVVADAATGGKPFDVVPCAQETKPTTQPTTV